MPQPLEQDDQFAWVLPKPTSTGTFKLLAWQGSMTCQPMALRHCSLRHRICFALHISNEASLTKIGQMDYTCIRLTLVSEGVSGHTRSI